MSGQIKCMLSLFCENGSGWFVHDFDFLPELVSELRSHLPHLLFEFFPLAEFIFLFYGFRFVLELYVVGFEFICFNGGKQGDL